MSSLYNALQRFTSHPPNQFIALHLPVPSVRKLFRDHFDESSPIELDMSDRRKVVRYWKDQLERMEGTQLTRHPGDRDSRSRTLVRFTIPDPNRGLAYRRANELRLEHDENHTLLISQYLGREAEHSRKVSDIVQIDHFVRDVQERYAKRYASQQRRAKVNQLKTKAILAQVKSMAKTEGFRYASTSNTQKVKLYVQLRGKELLEIHIPFAQFEQVLPRIKQTIGTMINLHQAGLRFKVTSDHSISWSLDWIDHENL